MFGKIVDASTAPVCSLLLGRDRVTPGVQDAEVVMYVPLQEAVCLVVTEGGRAFTPTRNWLYGKRWDITSNAQFRSDPRSYSIGNDDPAPGELGYDDGIWFLAANLSERDERWTGWVNLTSGEIIQQRLELVRFQRWALVCSVDGVYDDRAQGAAQPRQGTLVHHGIAEPATR